MFVQLFSVMKQITFSLYFLMIVFFSFFNVDEKFLGYIFCDKI